MKVPVRLVVERWVGGIMGRGAVACLEDNDVRQGGKVVVLVLGEKGVLAFGGAFADDPPEAPAGWAAVPEWCVSVQTGGNEGGADRRAKWWRAGKAHATAPTAKELERSALAVDRAWGKRIVRSVRAYYTVQVLEPSVRGFLSILEKQFPRADLYLWELLQNAVDDEASEIILEPIEGGGAGDGSAERRDKDRRRDSGGRRGRGGSGSEGWKGLVLRHNGRAFNPLDVLGLCSVGLSTKQLAGKRSIGFMGIGFKAVYKRFRKVTVQDGTWQFRFEEPPKRENTNTDQVVPDPPHAWVMKPNSVEDEGGWEGGWVRFILQRPRGPLEGDLKQPPSSVPPLLGRAAMRRRVLADGWRLRWNGSMYHVTTEASSQEHHGHGRVERLNVAVTYPKTDSNTTSRRTRWLMLTTRAMPGDTAARTYTSHTKRAPRGDEEVCLFFPVQSATSAASAWVRPVMAAKGANGKVHCTLPTQCKLPFPMHMDGPFLLNVDRQGMDLSSNEWNRCLLNSLPNLLTELLGWSTRTIHAATRTPATRDTLPGGGNELQRAARVAVASMFSLLPPMRCQNGTLFTKVLGQDIKLCSLKRYVWDHPVMPVHQENSAAPGMDHPKSPPPGDTWSTTSSLSATTSIGFVKGRDAVWLPSPFLRLLPPSFLAIFARGPVLATDVLSEIGFDTSPFWVACGRPPAWLGSSSPNQAHALPPRTPANVASAPELPTLAVRLLAATEQALEQAGHSSAGGVGKGRSREQVEQEEDGIKIPRKLNQYPVWLTANEDWVTADRIRYFDFSFGGMLPADLAGMLASSLLPPTLDGGRSKQRRSGGYGKHRSEKARRPPQLHALHPKLQEILHTGSEDGEYSHDVLAAARRCLDRVAAESPESVVTIELAFERTMERLATAGSSANGMSRKIAMDVVELTRWAVAQRKTSLVSHALVGTEASGWKLVRVESAYLGQRYDADDDETGSRIQDAAPHLAFISPLYMEDKDEATGAAARRRWREAWVRAGARRGVRFIAKATTLKKTDSSIIAMLPQGRMPQRRKTAPSGQPQLPHGCGSMHKNNIFVVDAALCPDWTRQLRSIAAFPTRAAAFASLLARTRLDTTRTPTASTVPAASAAFRPPGAGSGGGEVGSGADQNREGCVGVTEAVPARKRVYWLPPGQAGASAVDVGPATWVVLLSKTPWVPSQDPSQGLFPPRQILLAPDPARPDMPVALLPAAAIRVLADPALTSMLNWGTEAPPPPLDRLLRLIDSLPRTGDPDIDPADKAAEMVPVWRAVARAWAAKRMAQADKAQITSRAKSGRCVLPATGLAMADGAHFLGADRCWETNDRSKVGETSSLLGCVLVDACYGLCVTDRKWVLADDGKAIADLLGLPLNAGGRASQRYLAWISDRAPPQPSPAMVAAYTRALHCITLKCLSGSGTGTGSEEETAQSRVRGLLRRYLPKLSVYCVRNKHKPEQWLKVWLTEGDQHVRPVVDDDTSRSRADFIAQTHSYQVMGVLRCRDPQLRAMELEIVKVLEIKRLSGPDFSIRTRVRGEEEELDEPSERLSLVLRLLEHGAGSGGGDETMAGPLGSPRLHRYEKLARDFHAGNEVVKAEQFAIWGRIQGKEGRHVLVAGDSDDYIVELTDLMYSHALSCGLVFYSRPGKELRLLQHLEGDRAFFKFLKRDFGGLAIVADWEKERAIRARRDRALGVVASVMASGAGMLPVEDAQVVEKYIKVLQAALNEAEELGIDDSEEKMKNGRTRIGRLVDALETWRHNAVAELRQAMQVVVAEGKEGHAIERIRKNIRMVQARAAEQGAAELMAEAKAMVERLERELKARREQNLKRKNNEAALAVLQDVGTMVTEEEGCSWKAARLDLQAGGSGSGSGSVAAGDAGEIGAGGVGGIGDGVGEGDVLRGGSSAAGMGRGRGRGLAMTTPAWMAGTGSSPATAQPSLSSAAGASAPVGVDPTGKDRMAQGPEKRADGPAAKRPRPATEAGPATKRPRPGSSPPDVANRAAAGAPDVCAPAALPGKGRGRGLTLPSWMTSKPAPLGSGASAAATASQKAPQSAITGGGTGHGSAPVAGSIKKTPSGVVKEDGGLAALATRTRGEGTAGRDKEGRNEDDERANLLDDLASALGSVGMAAERARQGIVKSVGAVRLRNEDVGEMITSCNKFVGDLGNI